MSHAYPPPWDKPAETLLFFPSPPLPLQPAAPGSPRRRASSPSSWQLDNLQLSPRRPGGSRSLKRPRFARFRPSVPHRHLLLLLLSPLPLQLTLADLPGGGLLLTHLGTIALQKLFPAFKQPESRRWYSSRARTN